MENINSNNDLVKVLKWVCDELEVLSDSELRMEANKAKRAFLLDDVMLIAYSYMEVWFLDHVDADAIRCLGPNMTPCVQNCFSIDAMNSNPDLKAELSRLPHVVELAAGLHKNDGLTPSQVKIVLGTNQGVLIAALKDSDWHKQMEQILLTKSEVEDDAVTQDPNGSDVYPFTKNYQESQDDTETFDSLPKEVQYIRTSYQMWCEGLNGNVHVIGALETELNDMIDCFENLEEVVDNDPDSIIKLNSLDLWTKLISHVRLELTIPKSQALNASMFKMVRKLILNTEEMSERQERQINFTSWGLGELFVILIGSTASEALKGEGMRLAMTLLEGGQLTVQDTLMEYFRNTRTEEFFADVQKRLITVRTEIKTRRKLLRAESLKNTAQEKAMFAQEDMGGLLILTCSCSHK